MSDTVPQASALKLAILFHETYERLAPSFGYETRADTKTFDPESKNGRLMVAVCGEIASQPPAAIAEQLQPSGASPAVVEAEAARYRWLRDHSQPGICTFYLSVGNGLHGVKFTRETVDEAIDAQIAALADPAFENIADVFRNAAPGGLD